MGADVTDRYDIVVIGAGVAGAAFAAGVASPRRRVLLIERASWPREKVCGGCLNSAALATLHRLGLLDGLDGVSTGRVELVCRSKRATVTTPPGLAVLRSALDAFVVARACERGVEFSPGTSGTVCRSRAGERRVRLCGERGGTVSAAVVVAADGVSGASLRELPVHVETSRRSRFGVSTVLPADAVELPPGVVRMHVGAKGYVGMVRLVDGATDVAAALDPVWTKETGGPGPAVAAVLGECGVHWALPPGTEFHGSGLMSRRRSPVALPGLLVLGDAAGFVEPFTGEGMAWALAGAEAAAGMVNAGLAGEDLATAWRTWHARRVRPRQLVCAALRQAVRSPWLAGSAVGLLAAVPAAGRAATGLSRLLARPYGALAVSAGAIE